jgi:hypothetical protein
MANTLKDSFISSLFSQLIFFVVILLAGAANAKPMASPEPRSSGPGLNSFPIAIEPIIGVETTYDATPTPHTSTRTIYGARLSAGPQYLAIEAEYTKGGNEENYSVAPQTVKHDVEAAKLGLRSNYDLGSYLYFGFRAGAQVTRDKMTSTSNGVATETDSQNTAPYAGANLGIHLGPYVSLNASSTVVIHDANSMEKNELQNTLSISAGFHY